MQLDPAPVCHREARSDSCSRPSPRFEVRPEQFCRPEWRVGSGSKPDLTARGGRERTQAPAGPGEPGAPAPWL